MHELRPTGTFINTTNDQEAWLYLKNSSLAPTGSLWSSHSKGSGRMYLGAIKVHFEESRFQWEFGVGGATAWNLQIISLTTPFLWVGEFSWLNWHIFKSVLIPLSLRKQDQTLRTWNSSPTHWLICPLKTYLHQLLYLQKWKNYYTSLWHS